MNIGSNIDPFSDPIGPEIMHDIQGDQLYPTNEESSILLELQNPDDSPYIPQVRLISQSKEEFIKISSQDMPSEYFPTMKEEIVILKKLDEPSTEEPSDQKTESSDVGELWNEFFYALPENIQEDTNEKKRLLKVTTYDLKTPERYSSSQLESVKKAYDAGIGLLLPRIGEGPFLVQENLASLLAKHNITEVEAVMPTGEAKVFKAVKFQTITGATSSALSRAFNQLSTVIYLAKEREAQIEKEQEEKELARLKRNQLNSNIGNGIKAEDKIEYKKLTRFELCFCLIQGNKHREDVTIEMNQKIYAKQKKEEVEKEKEKDTGYRIIKEDQTKFDRKKEDIKKDNISKETQQTQINRGRKEKIKVSNDPNAPPVDVIDYTKEKRPS